MTCKHERIQTWRFDTQQGEPAGMWSCVACGLRFEPPDLALIAERDALLVDVARLTKIIDDAWGEA